MRVDSVIGIDLSGLSRATKGRTVAAQVALEDPLRLVELIRIRPGVRGDFDLLAWIRDSSPSVVGIDASLSLPHSVTCQADECERCLPGQASYLGRDVDRMVGGMPTVMLAAIAFRGIYLARQLRTAGTRVIEVYPGAAYSAWGILDRSVASIANHLESLLGRFDWATRDDLDAVCAAVITARDAEGSSLIVAGNDGTIVSQPVGSRLPDST